MSCAMWPASAQVLRQGPGITCAMARWCAHCC
jgi:hypothetical protein